MHPYLQQPIRHITTYYLYTHIYTHTRTNAVTGCAILPSVASTIGALALADSRPVSQPYDSQQGKLHAPNCIHGQKAVSQTQATHPHEEKKKDGHSFFLAR